MNANNTHKYTKIDILPKDWKRFRLGDIVSINATKINPEISNSCPCIELEHLSQDTGQILGFVESSNQKSIKNSFQKGQILFGKLRPYLRKFWRAEFDGVCSSEIWVMSGKKVSNNFLFYLIQTQKFIQIANVSVGTKMPRADWYYMQEIPFFIPPLAEQEKIAQILGVWDKGISVLKSLIEAKTKRKKALMQRLLTPPCESLMPSLRASETSAAIHNKSVDCHDLTASNLAKTEKDSKAKQSLRFAEFTDKWQEMRLGDICEIYQPQTIPQSDFTKEGYNVYGANGLIGKYHSYNHEKEQIAIACRGNSCGAVNFTNPKSWITGNAMVINLDNSKNADKIFVYYVLLNSNLNYLVTGSGQPQITSNIKNHSIKLPTLAEQKKIAQVLSACDKEIELLKSKFQCLKTQKKGLMQRLLNGKVRVKI